MTKQKFIGKHKKCYNCKHASKQFKIAGISHVHCQNENLYPAKDFESGQLSAWETLREFWDKCNLWEDRKI